MGQESNQFYCLTLPQLIRILRHQLPNTESAEKWINLGLAPAWPTSWHGQTTLWYTERDNSTFFAAVLHSKFEMVSRYQCICQSIISVFFSGPAHCVAPCASWSLQAHILGIVTLIQQIHCWSLSYTESSMVMVMVMSFCLCQCSGQWSVTIALCESWENGVWSGQLWQMNSPQIFNEN